MEDYGSTLKNNLVFEGSKGALNLPCETTKEKRKKERSTDSETVLLPTNNVKRRVISKKNVTVVGLAALICVAVAVSVYVGLNKQGDEVKIEVVYQELDPPDVTSPLPPSKSSLGEYTTAVVVSNGQPCAAIGREILKKNGSAIDALIATMLCDGVNCFHNMGLGGGFLMTYYIKADNKVVTLNARESAPAGATKDMYKNNKTLSQNGGLSVAIPGELRGYHEAWKKYGRLSWAELFEPTIKLCEEGVPINEHLATNIETLENEIRESPTLSKMLLSNNNTLPKYGDYIKLPKLAETLKIIANSSLLSDELYSGSLTEGFVNDIQKAGGIITMEDMKNYKAEWRDPIVANLSGGLTMYSMPPPGSGVLVGFILRVLDGFVQNATTDVEMTQRITEAFKHAYGHRSFLGDPSFHDISEVMKQLTSEDFIQLTRSKISDTKTSQDPKFYGAEYAHLEDHGTANIAVLAPNGDAAVATSTVNLLFGSKLVSESTGIILNDEMDDFSAPDFANFFGIPPSPANFIVPGKRPLSSMCPTIILDSNNQVRLALGSAGGTKITTSTALVSILNLWYNKNIKEAIDSPRFHHQLMPMKFAYEYGTHKDIPVGMSKIGHKTERLGKSWGSCVTAIARNGSNYVTGNSDFRRPGSVAGF